MVWCSGPLVRIRVDVLGHMCTVVSRACVRVGQRGPSVGPHTSRLNSISIINYPLAGAALPLLRGDAFRGQPGS